MPQSRLFVNSISSYLLWNGSAPIPTQPFTFAIWVRKDNTPTTFGGIFQQRQAGNRRVNFVILDNSGAKLLMNTNDDASGDDISLFTANTISQGVWTHIFGSVVSGAGDSYLVMGGDLANMGVDTGTGSPDITGHDDSWFGGFTSAASGVPTTAFWDGPMAWGVFWNIQLDPIYAQVMAQGRHPMTIFPQNITHAFPLWGYHDPEIDLGSSHDATFTDVSTSTLDVGPPMEVWQPTKKSFWFPAEVAGAPTTVNLGVLALDITMVALSVQTGVTVALATQALDITMQALTVQTGTSVELGTIALDITMGALTVQTGVTVELGVILLDITMQAITVETTTSVALGVIAMDIALQPLSVSTGVTVALGTVALDITLKALSVSIPTQVTTTVELGTVLMVFSIPEVFSVQVSDGISTSVRVVLDVIPMNFYLQPLNKPYNRCGTVVFKADPSEVVTYLADASEVVGYSADASETVTFQACAN